MCTSSSQFGVCSYKTRGKLIPFPYLCFVVVYIFNRLPNLYNQTHVQISISSTSWNTRFFFVLSCVVKNDLHLHGYNLLWIRGTRKIVCRSGGTWRVMMVWSGMLQWGVKPPKSSKRASFVGYLKKRLLQRSENED